jgi:hypothetical protein
MTISRIERPAVTASSSATKATTTETASSAGVAPVEGVSPFARLLHGLGNEAKAGEATIRSAVRASAAGKDLGPSELLALQAGVYRYSEVIDLAAKLVDRASNGVKTVLSGQ